MTRKGTGNLLLTVIVLVVVGALGYYAVVRESDDGIVQPLSTGISSSPTPAMAPAYTPSPPVLPPLLETLMSLDPPSEYYMKASWPEGWTSYAKDNLRLSMKESLPGKYDVAKYSIPPEEYLCKKSQQTSTWNCTPCTRGIPFLKEYMPDNKAGFLTTLRLYISRQEGWDKYLGRRRISGIDVECFNWGCFHPDVFLGIPTLPSGSLDVTFFLSNVPEEEFKLPEPRVIGEPRDCDENLDN